MRPDDSPLLAGIELGGTKAIVTLARDRHIIDQARWPTTTPAQTLAEIGDHLLAWHRRDPVTAIGIASFGPLHLDPQDAAFGHIGRTPKPGWTHADVHGHFAALLPGLPVGIDTDVAGAALAEGRWGAAQGCAVHIYITIGTGVGIGVVVDGKPVHGRIHPEAGHLRIRRVLGDAFAGVCPFHGDCIEGLVSGPALAARAGGDPAVLPAAHPLWDNVAADIGEMLAILILTLSPQRIVIGGGVGLGQQGLLARARARCADALAGYLVDHAATDMDTLIVPAALGNDAGPLGAILIAQQALGDAR